MHNPTLGSTFLPTSDGRRFYGTEFFVLSPPVGSLATLTVLAALGRLARLARRS